MRLLTTYILSIQIRFDPNWFYKFDLPWYIQYRTIQHSYIHMLCKFFGNVLAMFHQYFGNLLTILLILFWQHFCNVFAISWQFYWQYTGNVLPKHCQHIAKILLKHCQKISKIRVHMSHPILWTLGSNCGEIHVSGLWLAKNVTEKPLMVSTCQLTSRNEKTHVETNERLFLGLNIYAFTFSIFQFVKLSIDKQKWEDTLNQTKNFFKAWISMLLHFLHFNLSRQQLTCRNLQKQTNKTKLRPKY